MLRRVQVREKNINLSYTSSNTGGNYIVYFNLVIQFYKTLFKTEFKNFPLKDKIQIYFMTMLKTPWWLLIKPLGCFFTVHKTYQGNFYCKIQDGSLSIIDFSKVNKSTKISLFNKIPLWFFKTNTLSKDDQQLLIEKYV